MKVFSLKKLIVTALILTLFLTGGLMGAVAPLFSAQAYQAVEDIDEKGYLDDGGTFLGSFTETVTYHRREVESFIFNPALPGYIASQCGVESGINIVAWYNRIYPQQLIPGHNPGIAIGPAWIWAAPTVHLANASNQLYADMNATPNGVTIAGYLGGLNTYANRMGFSFLTGSLMHNGALSPSYKAALQNGWLISVFVDGFNVAPLNAFRPNFPGVGQDTYGGEEYSGAHIMTAYGFMEIKYFNANNTMFRSDIYLYVNVGLGGGLGLTRLTTHTVLDDARVTHIF
jgi:hypothetical protein